MEYLLLDGVAVPVNGPVANISGFIAEKGSLFKTLKSESESKSYVSLADNPTPPI